jgi:hypothetical protein
VEGENGDQEREYQKSLAAFAETECMKDLFPTWTFRFPARFSEKTNKEAVRFLKAGSHKIRPPPQESRE